MHDQFLYLWAQWGILNFEQYKVVLKVFGDLETAWHKINQPFLQQLGFGTEKAARVMQIRNGIHFRQLIESIEKHHIQILSIDDELYPSPLKQIPNPPPFLFVRGKLPSWHKAMAVVGTRQITSYGTYTTEKLTKNLVQNGFVVVSGLAMGVDALAHRTTLKEKGITVAVLGSAVDYISPATNRHLANQIIQNGGAIISEYSLDTPAAPHHFPERNRIISGLSRGVLVTEGGRKSGALITARYAIEQNRDVFAVPNNIHQTELSGTNHLIRKSEAKLVETIDDILTDYQMEAKPQQVVIEFSARESQLLESITNQSKSIDDLFIETKLNVATLSEILIGLQMKGVVRQIDQKWMLS